MVKIKQLTKRFRKAIEIAFDEDQFRSHPPLSRFPKDCCDFACDLLGQFLLENGIETHQVNGACTTDMSWHHAWLLTDDGIVIDITGDQFIGKLVSADEVSPTQAGSENKIHKLFCKNRHCEQNTNFTDARVFTGFNGSPNRRQRDLYAIYQIICQCLSINKSANGLSITC